MFAAFLQDCEEVRLAGHQSSGVYSVYSIDMGTSVDVYCDMETTSGGWLVRKLLL